MTRRYRTRCFQRLFTAETGGATTDWIVLSVALIGLGLAITSQMTGAVDAAQGSDASLTVEGFEKPVF